MNWDSFINRKTFIASILGAGCFVATGCAPRAAAILCGSVLHAKLTPSTFDSWSGADQASTGSSGTKAVAGCG